MNFSHKNSRHHLRHGLLAALLLTASTLAAQTVTLNPPNISVDEIKNVVRWLNHDGCGLIHDYNFYTRGTRCPPLAGDRSSASSPLGGCRGCNAGSPSEESVEDQFANWPFSVGGQDENAGPFLDGLFTLNNSIIQNLRMHYIHWATDVRPTATSPLMLRRYHMSRRYDWEGSFGPRTFCNYDVTLKIIGFGGDQEEGDSELMDPALTEIVTLVNKNFEDWDNGGGSLPIEFEPVDMSRTKIIRVLDDTLQPVMHSSNPAADAEFAELLTWSGEKFLFQLVADATYPGDFHWGYLVKITDSRGRYVDIVRSGKEISYVEDQAGRQIQFQYISGVAGQTAISSITAPSGKVTTYSYSDMHLELYDYRPEVYDPELITYDDDTLTDHLSIVNHAGGMTSTFDVAFDRATGLTAHIMNDPAADDGHRSKQVYMGPLVFASIGLGSDRDPVLSTEAGAVKFVTAGEEVTYADMEYLAYDNGNGTLGRLIYEGGNKLKTIRLTDLAPDPNVPYDGLMLSVHYFDQGWSLEIPEPWWDDHDRYAANQPSGSGAPAGGADGAQMGTANGFYDGMLDRDYYNLESETDTEFDFPVTAPTQAYLLGETINGNWVPGFAEAYFNAYLAAYYDGAEETWDYRPLVSVNGTQEQYFDALVAEDQPQFVAGRARWRLTRDGKLLEYDYGTTNLVTRIFYRNDTDFSDDTVEAFCYDSNCRLTRRRDRLGNVTKFEYDSSGNVTKRLVGLTEDPASNPLDPYGGYDNCGANDNQSPEYAEYQFQFQPSATGDRLVAKIDPKNHQTDYVHDTSGQISEVKQPADSTGGTRPTTQLTYTSAGQISTVTDPEGHQLQFFYDNFGRRTSVLFDDGTTQQTVYTGGEMTKTIDRGGVVTTYSYDSAGRLETKVTAAAQVGGGSEVPTPELASTETYTYVEGTRSPAKVVRDGAVTEYAYDGRMRRVSTKVSPSDGVELTTQLTYVDNLLFNREDPYGRKTYYAYDATDRRQIRTVTATTAEFSLADYTAVLNLTRDLTANAAYLISDNVYDVGGNLLRSHDGRNIETHYQYDSRGRRMLQLAAAATAIEARTETDYDLNGNVTEVRSPRYFDAGDDNGYQKAREQWTYTDRGLVATHTEAPGTTVAVSESFVYDFNGRRVEHTDFAGKVWKTHYDDCCGQVTASENPLGHGSITRTNAVGQTVHQASIEDYSAHTAALDDPLDAKTYREVTTRYDGRGRPTLRTTWLVARGVVDAEDPPIAGVGGVPAADGLTEQYLYDDNLIDGVGLDSGIGISPVLGGSAISLAAAISQLGDSEANGGANVIFDSEAAGSARVTINGEGEVRFSITDAAGRGVISGVLDPSDSSLVTWSCSKQDETTSISGFGTVLVTKSINALGKVRQQQTDGAGRPLQSLDELDNITAYEYDAAGNQLKIRDPNSVGQDCTYDELGRDVSCTDTASATTASSYDRGGNKIAASDANSNTTIYEFDARGRQVKQIDRLGGETEFAYTATSQLASLTDAEDQVTSYTYDDAGTKLTETYPDHVTGSTAGQSGYGIVTFTPDPTGRTIRKQDQLGDTVTYNYDLAGRLVSRDYRTAANSPSGTIADSDTFTYDGASRMLTAVSGRYSNTVTYTYDAAGRKSTEALTIAGQTYTTTTTYNAVGRVSGYTYPDGTAVGRSYTDRGQLATIDLDSTTIDTRTYDDGGRLLSSAYNNGVTATHSYNTDNTLASITHSGASIGNYSYGWDANKNKTSETITGTMSGYGFDVGASGYDNEDRLINWQRDDTNLDQSWNLSLVGDWNSITENSSTQNRTHGPAHELLTAAGQSITHDAKGNITSIPAILRPGSDPLALTWDFDNRLSSADIDNDTIDDVAYKFDALGRRVGRDDGTTNTIYVQNGQQTFADYASGAAPTSPTYTYLYASYIDEPVLRDGGGLRYFHRNQQYSITALTNASAAIQERYAYTAYGEPTILDANAQTLTATSSSNRYTYTGREWDEDLELYHYRARMYDPLTDRFCSRDPAKYADSKNLFERKSPLYSTDPSGRITITTIGETKEKNPGCPRRGFQRRREISWKFRRSPGGRVCSGWIVQEIKIYCNRQPCGALSEFYCPQRNAPFPISPSATFYEAWRVEEGSDEAKSDIDGGFRYTDQSLPRVSGGTCGQYYARGTVRFFCDTDANGQPREGLPDAWHPFGSYPLGNCGNVQVGELPSTSQRPGWWADSDEVSANRVNSLNWNCCCPDQFIEWYRRPSKY